MQVGLLVDAPQKVHVSLQTTASCFPLIDQSMPACCDACTTWGCCKQLLEACDKKAQMHTKPTLLGVHSLKMQKKRETSTENMGACVLLLQARVEAQPQQHSPLALTWDKSHHPWPLQDLPCLCNHCSQMHNLTVVQRLNSLLIGLACCPMHMLHKGSHAQC